MRVSSAVLLVLTGATLVALGGVGFLLSPVCGVALLVGVLLIVAGLLLVLYGPSRRRMSQSQSQVVYVQTAQPMPYYPPPPQIEREVIREVVKVPCRYCGTLVELRAPYCHGCGAPVQ